MPEFNENWKGDLANLTGRTITGYGTGAMGGRLTSLTVTLDDGTWFMLSAHEFGSFINVRHRGNDAK